MVSRKCVLPQAELQLCAPEVYDSSEFHLLAVGTNDAQTWRCALRRWEREKTEAKSRTWESGNRAGKRSTLNLKWGPITRSSASLAEDVSAILSRADAF